jgi:D-inositol-3-phosphate glycosyltransferase
MTRLRIAMVSEHASPLAALGGADAGGQNVHVAALATHLARAGHEVVVHTRRDDAALPRRVVLDTRATGGGAGRVVVDHVDAGPPVAVPKDDLLGYMDEFAAALADRWRHERPDVVHAHFWMSGLAGLAAAGPRSIPVVQTFHALGVVKRRHQNGRDTSPAARPAIERRLVHEVDHVVATCTDEVTELRRLGATPDRTTIVPCGVDTACFTARGPLSPPRRAGLRRLVAVGRLVERKGFADVIDALADVPDTELLIAGGPAAAGLADDPEARRLRARAAERAVGDRVRLLGRLGRAELPALLRSADAVVCVPWYEPFGIVPLEAMACGVPVVASAVGGLTDTVVDGVTGVLVAPRRPDDLAVALTALLADPDRRRALGAAGADRARLRYRWSRVAADTAAVYRRLLDRRQHAVTAVAAVDVPAAEVPVASGAVAGRMA